MQPSGFRNDGGLMRRCVLFTLRDKDEIFISSQDVPFVDNPYERLLLRISIADLRLLLDQAAPELLAPAPVEDRP